MANAKISNELGNNLSTSKTNIPLANDSKINNESKRFETILSVSRARFVQFDTLRAQWEAKGDFYADHKTEKGKQNCAWCTKGKRADFKEEDRTTDSVWCGWCIDHQMLMPGSTGYEPCLKGVSLPKLIALNSYILTTASTNRPDDVKFQEMFLTFYAPQEIIDTIRQGIAKLADSHYEIESRKDEADCFGDYGPENNALIESMECVTVIDQLQKRRSLYDVLLNILSART
jgi:hypothetical protein